MIFFAGLTSKTSSTGRKSRSKAATERKRKLEEDEEWLPEQDDGLQTQTDNESVSSEFIALNNSHAMQLTDQPAHLLFVLNLSAACCLLLFLLMSTTTRFEIFAFYMSV